MVNGVIPKAAATTKPKKPEAHRMVGDQKRYKAGTTYSDLLHLPFLFEGSVKDVKDVVVSDHGCGKVGPDMSLV
jgi:hypothetical protein